jgi:carbamoyltransferase
MMNRYYIGLSATLHDPAVAILDSSGQVVFAEATERYLQNKRAYNSPPDDMLRIPHLVREYCGDSADVIAAISWSADYLRRLQIQTLSTLPLQQSFDRSTTGSWPVPDLAAIALGQRHSLGQAGLNLSSVRSIPNPVQVRYYDHHATHAASAVYTSPRADCLVAVVDGFGEYNAAAFFRSWGRRLAPIHAPDPEFGERPGSLGSFYGRVCALCGFDPIAGEEWKVMGLAAYGSIVPEMHALLRPTIRVDGLRLMAACSDAELARQGRELRALIRQDGDSHLAAADLARTGQAVFEELMVELLNNLRAVGDSDHLALCGGCALNSSFNGQVTRRVGFASVHVPPAPGDDGNALGAAFLAYADDHPVPETLPGNRSPFLGSAISPASLDALVSHARLPNLRRCENSIAGDVAQLLADGKIVGWMHGRAEFGPRALGNRSILADPRRAEMKDRINSTIKFREEFRPFAPSILAEYGPAYFEDYQDTPYMERALRFRSEVRANVPAVVHVDGTGRLQTVTRESNSRFYDLIAQFRDLTGVPLVLNTSLNVMGKPIAHSVEDAVGLFFTSGLDALAIDDWLLLK